MIIKLNVYPNGSCAQIYAYAEDHEEYYLYESLCKLRAVKIWHNDGGLKSLGVTPPVPLENCYNDYTVTFKSKVTFNEFCEQFSRSEFNDSSKYHPLTHNCSHAANFALKLAGIDLNISNGIRLTKIPGVLFPIPFKALTPTDLYELAKKYKIKMLNEETKPLNNINFRTELAAKALTFRGRATQDDEVKHTVNTIAAEGLTELKQNPHHAEIYLKMMIDSVDILLNLSSKINDESYKNSANFFKTRPLTRPQALQAELEFEFTRYLASQILLSFFTNLLNPSLKLLLSAVVSIPLFSTSYQYIKAAREESYSHVPNEKSLTALSQAMIDLSDHLEEKDKTIAQQKLR